VDTVNEYTTEPKKPYNPLMRPYEHLISSNEIFYETKEESEDEEEQKSDLEKIALTWQTN